jgi:hypothetical protein
VADDLDITPKELLADVSGTLAGWLPDYTDPVERDSGPIQFKIVDVSPDGAPEGEFVIEVHPVEERSRTQRFRVTVSVEALDA